MFFLIKRMVDPHHIFLMVLDYDTWHNTNMSHGILEFGQNKSKSIFRWVGETR
jgi:hypothetical protein